MRAIHIGGLNYANGGPSLSTFLTIKGLIANGVDAHCMSRALQLNDKLVCDEKYVTFFKKPLIKLAGFEIISKISSVINKQTPIDIMHLQGIWSYHMHKAARYAMSNNIPYIIAPRGSLYPQALEISKLKKKISMGLYQKRELESAACIQVTCNQELKYYRELGFTNPVAIIPNPIEEIQAKEVISKENQPTRFGYLGRLHPRKRVERLIYAFSDNRDLFKNCELWIIGSDVIEYEEFLKGEVKRLGLNNVFFKGFLQGDEKDMAIRSLSFLVNPSDFENFGNVITESLSRGVPVIATKGSPWQIVEQYKCGWWIENDQASISNTMIEALNTTPETRLVMGNNGRELVKKEFSVNILGQKMKILYEWILKGGDTPSFVDVV